MTRRQMQKASHCYYCGSKPQSLDHYIPRSRGGKTLDNNLVPACLTCNAEKRDMLPEEYRVYRVARHMLATQGSHPVVNMLSLIPAYTFYGETHDIDVYPDYELTNITIPYSEEEVPHA